MAKFLTTVGNSFYIEQIIINSTSNFTLVTPYLQLSQNMIERISDAEKEGVKITLIYGKNELSVKEHNKIFSLSNIQIFFCKNLHAKCYHNEDSMIITSMNLFEFSERNNREMGIFIEKASDMAIFNDAIKEIDSIKNASILEKKFEDVEKTNVKNIDGFKLEPNFEDTYNFHLPELYRILSEKYTDYKFSLKSEIEVVDFPCKGIQMTVNGTVDFDFDDSLNYPLIKRMKRDIFDKEFPKMRFYWNYYRLKIYGEKGVTFELTEEGLAQKLSQFLKIIDFAHLNLKKSHLVR